MRVGCDVLWPVAWVIVLQTHIAKACQKHQNPDYQQLSKNQKVKTFFILKKIFILEKANG